MVNLIISAVGEPYISDTLSFLKERNTAEHNIHILTDKPKLFPEYNTTCFYRSYFNFFDKFLFGLKVIEQTKQPGFIWDADLLSHFDTVHYKFNLEGKNPQFAGYWLEGNTLDYFIEERKHFFNLLDTWLEKNQLTRKDIYMLQEHWSFWPYRDYSKTVDLLSHLSHLFEANSRINGGHKNSFGNGEGAGISTALKLSGIEFDSITVD